MNVKVSNCLIGQQNANAYIDIFIIWKSGPVIKRRSHFKHQRFKYLNIKTISL